MHHTTTGQREGGRSKCLKDSCCRSAQVGVPLLPCCAPLQLLPLLGTADPPPPPKGTPPHPHTVCVALNSPVRRCLGSRPMMASSCCLKPMSNSLSASSSTWVCVGWGGRTAAADAEAAGGRHVALHSGSHPHSLRPPSPLSHCVPSPQRTSSHPKEHNPRAPPSLPSLLPPPPKHPAIPPKPASTNSPAPPAALCPVLPPGASSHHPAAQVCPQECAHQQT